MEVIPVLDLKEGNVVWAFKGERTHYLPISDSKVTDSPDPIATVDALIKNFDFNKFYIADLDAIETKGDNFKIIEEIKNRFNPYLMVDIGIKTEEDLEKSVIKYINSLILGTETLYSLEVADKAIRLFSPEKIIISIDIDQGKIRTCLQNFRNIQSAITEFTQRGLINFILLELSSVGSLKGPQEIVELIPSILNRYRHLNIYVGGGIRNIKDIVLLQEFGVKGILVATALHRELIRKEELEELKK